MKRKNKHYLVFLNAKLYSNLNDAARSINVSENRFRKFLYRRITDFVNVSKMNGKVITEDDVTSVFFKIAGYDVTVKVN